MLLRILRQLVMVAALLGLACGSKGSGPEESVLKTDVHKTRFSVWYWLNAVPREKWREDFSRIRKNGFDDVILCWGYDLSAFRLRKEDSLGALELCRENGLGAYLLVWHPIHNSLLLEAEPAHFQVDNLGQRRFSFNLFNRDWRQTQWKDYLVDICSTYKDSPALSGYVFDDSFAVGPIESFGGVEGATAGDFVSYSESDQNEFQAWLQARYPSLDALNSRWDRAYSDWSEIETPKEIAGETIWQDWTDARTEWLEEWAKETMQFIREVDQDPEHMVYIEDLATVLGTESQASDYSNRPITVVDVAGLRFGRVTRHFDRLGAYTMPSWESADSLARGLEITSDVIDETVAQAGNVDQLVYTFWISAPNQVFQPGPVTRPTAEEVWELSKVAMRKGVKYIDYYAYDVGYASLSGDEEWKAYLPGTAPDYPLSKQFRGKWLTDRPGEVLETLGRFISESRNAVEPD